MGINNCEQCGSDENVTNFLHYDTRKREYLCWDCREPIIKERVDATDSADESEDEPEELSGQTGLGDWS